MRPFALRARRRRRRPRSRCSPSAGRALPRRRHEPRRPDEARRRARRRCSSTSPGSAADGSSEPTAAACASAPPCATATSPPTRSCASATRSLSAGAARTAPPASCATSPRSAATCSSARAARTSRTSTKPCNKREPGIGLPGARGRAPQPRDPRRTPRHCVATHPSDMAVALAALDAVVHVPARTARARSRSPDLHRLPGDAPERDTVLAPGELITAVELPPPPAAARSRYRKVRERASFAFALVSVAARARRRGRPGARRAGSRSAASPTALAGRDAPRPRCAGAPATEEAFAAAAADAELARRRAAARQRLQGRRWPATCIVRTLPTLAAWPHDARHAARSVGARWTASRAREGHRRGALRLEHPRERRRLRRGSCSRRSPRGRIERARRRTPRSRCPASLAVLTPRERAAAAARPSDAELAVLQSPASPTAARSSPLVVAETLEAAREAAAARARRLRARSRTTSCSRADHPGLYTPEKVNPASRPTPPQGDFDGAFAAAAVAVDATYETPAAAQQPDGAARDDRACGTATRLTLYDSTQGAAPARARRSPRSFGLDAGARARDRASTSAAASAPRARRGRNVVLAAMAAQASRPAGQARGDPPADVRVHRLPHADDPAHAARRGRGRPAARRSPTTSSSRPRRCASSPSRPPSPPAMMYAAPNRRTTPPAGRARRARRRRGCARRASARACSRSSRRWTSWPIALGLDPIELRIRNEPDVDPESGHPVQLAATWSRACARAPSASAGPTATRARPRRDGPLAGRHGRRRLDLSRPRAGPSTAPRPRGRGRRATWSASPPPTSARARARC